MTLAKKKNYGEKREKSVEEEREMTGLEK